MDKGQRPCHIDDGGNLTYSTSPAETLGSEAMGMPAKGGSPWTNQTHGSSSASRSSKTRQQQRRQMPKQSFLDAISNNSSVDDGQDDHDGGMHFSRNPASLVPAPFDDMVHSNKSSLVTGPRAMNGRVDESTNFIPPSGQKALPSMTDDGEDGDADNSPTPKPGRTILSRKRTMSDASDVTGSAQLKGVASSRQRKMSEPPIIDERPKKKGIPQFSSHAPSVADSVGEGPSQNIPECTQKKPGMFSHSASHPKKIPAHRQKTDLKSKAKLNLSALDLEEHEEGNKENEDPFDQANIPPSRGLSPGASIRKPKPAPKKKTAEKSSKTSLAKHKPSPRGNKPTKESQKVSTQKTQPARPKQKAKPSVAKPVQLSVAPVRGRDNGYDGSPPNNPTRSSANGARAKANRTSAAASSLTQNAKASGQNHSDPEEDAISISSASGSEDPDTDGLDDDEYVDKSRSIAVDINSEPPVTRNTTATYEGRNGSAYATDSRGDMQVTEDDSSDKQAQDENAVAFTVLEDEYTVDAVVQAPNQNAEVLVSQQINEKATDTQAFPLRPNKTNSDQGQQSPARNQSGADDTKTESPAADVVEPPLEQARTTHPIDSTSKGAGSDQDQSAPNVTTRGASGRLRTRITRRSPSNQPENDSTPSNRKAAQMKEQVKKKTTLVDKSPMDFQARPSKAVIDSKSKDMEANIISLNSDGLRTDGMSSLGASAGIHKSREPDSEVSNIKPSEATEAEQSDAGSNVRTCNSSESTRETARPPKSPMAPIFQTQQAYPLVNDQQPDVSIAVDFAVLSEETHYPGPDVSQMHAEKVAKEPQPVAREDDKHKGSPLTQATNEKLSAGDHNGASDMADFSFADGSVDRIDGPTIPDSLEQSDDIENIASVSQLEEPAIVSGLIGQELESGVQKRKHHLVYDCTNQTFSPGNEQSGVHFSIDDPKHSSSRHSEQQVIQSSQPQQSSPEQQSAKIRKSAKEEGPVMKKQPVWGTHPVKSQQHVSAANPLTAQRKDFNPVVNELKFPQHRESARPKQRTQTMLTQSQSGKGAAKKHSRDMSTTFERPSKRAKVDIPEPTAPSPAVDINTHFCLPTNSFSSDDVFAPNEDGERKDINHGIINRLRGIESEKDSPEPEMETQRPVDSRSENWHGPPQQCPSKHLAPKAVHTHFVRDAAHGQRPEDNRGAINGSNLRRRGLLNRYQGLVPLVQQRKQLATEDPKPQLSIGESMHQIVAVSLFSIELFSAVSDLPAECSTGLAFEGVSDPRGGRGL